MTSEQFNENILKYNIFVASCFYEKNSRDI